MRCSCADEFWGITVFGAVARPSARMRPGVLGQIRVCGNRGGIFRIRIANAPIPPSRCASYLAAGAKTDSPLLAPFSMLRLLRVPPMLAERKLDQTHAMSGEAVQLWPIIVKATERQILRCRPLGRLGSAICICLRTLGSWERRSGGLCGDETPVCERVELGTQLGHARSRSWELIVGVEAETEMHLLKADVVLKNAVGQGKTTKSKGDATVTVTEMSIHLLQRPKGK